MDLKKHQQTLMNIRSKYASLSFKSNQSSNNIQRENSCDKRDNQSSFHTPIKMLKHQPHSTSKKKISNKQTKQVSKEQNFTKKQPSNVQIISNKFSFSNDKTFDEVIAERNKQLTQRTQRNKQILSKSKQIRQKQSRNNSVQTNSRNKQNWDQKSEIKNLKLLLQDKNYIFSHQKAPNINNPKGQTTYSTIKENITSKMKQNLIQNLGINNKHQKVVQIQNKTVQIEGKNNLKHTSQRVKKYEASRQYSIKTPIPPPKQSSPNKIKSIFENTKKIEERIHALLSR